MGDAFTSQREDDGTGLPRVFSLHIRRRGVSPIRAVLAFAAVTAIACVAGAGAFAASAVGPRIVSLGVTPTGPTRVSVMTAKVATKDPGHRVMLRYRWLRDGVVIANATSQTIDLSRHTLRRGDRVRVRVTAVAGSRSVTKTSAAVVVADAVPRVTSVAIDPASTTEADVLSATLRASDADGDRLTEQRTWSWTCPGSASGTVVASTIALTDLGVGRGCRVSLSDRVSDGERSVSAKAPAVVVGDRAPVVGSVSLLPSSPTAAEVVTASAPASDPDGDPVTTTCAWTLGSAPVGTGACTLDLGAIGARKGDSVGVTVTAGDGTLSSTATAAATVADTAPMIGSVSIDTGSPTTDDTLHALVDASDADDDPVSLAYRWMVSGVPITGATGSSLDLSQPGTGERGDQITVKVTASDGTATDSATSAPVTIANTAPVLDDATIVYDPLTATATIDPDAVDADGDQLQTSVRWTVDGFDAGASATLDVAGADAYIGDELGARVRVTDSQGASSAWVAAEPVTIASGVPAAPPMNDWYPYTELNTSPVRAILPVRSNPDQLYVLDQLGFGSSSDAGATWSSAFGPCRTSGDAFTAAYAPSASQIVYVGCGSTGTYRSDDGGSTWQAIPISVGSTIEGVSALAVDPSEPDVVFAVCSACSTIWRSTDGGQTWQDAGSMPGWGASVAIDPSDSDHIVVGTENGVVVSRDGGATWSAPSSSGEMMAAFDPDSSALWAIDYDATTASVLRSADGGTTWTTVPGSPTQLTALAPGDGDIYVADKTGDVSQSTDGGTTWSADTLRANAAGRGQVDALAVDPTDANHVYVGFDTGGVWGVEFQPDALQGWWLYSLVQLDSVDVTPTTATIDASVAPVMPGDTGWIQWQWGSSAPTDNSKVTPLAGSNTEQPASTTLTGLAPNTTYRLMANGVFNDPFGGTFHSSTPEVTFTTPPA
jgi:photosystem II stability/assembly factor-like uncharacterized protein